MIPRWAYGVLARTLLAGELLAVAAGKAWRRRDPHILHLGVKVASMAYRHRDPFFLAPYVYALRKTK